MTWQTYQRGLLLRFFDSGTGKGRLAHRRVSIGADTRFWLVGHRVERERFGPKNEFRGNIFAHRAREPFHLSPPIVQCGRRRGGDVEGGVGGSVLHYGAESENDINERLSEGTCASLLGVVLGCGVEG